MLKPERMAKCRIVAAKTQLSAVINILYDLGLYHITPHMKGELDIGEPLVSAEELSEVLVKIKKLREKYPKKVLQTHTPLTKKDWEQTKKKVDALFSGLEDTEKRLSQLESEKKQVVDTLQALSMLKNLNIDLEQLQNSQYLCSFFGTINKAETIKEELSKLTAHANISLKDNQVLVVGKKEDETAIGSLLGEHGFVEHKVGSGTPAALKKTLGKKEADEKKLQAQLTILKKEAGEVAKLESSISEEIRKQELPLHFAVTKSSFVAEGWIPHQDAQKVRDSLGKATDNQVHIVIEQPEKKETPPIKLRHSRLVSPFEFLIRLFDLPRYKEFDPTLLVFWTFPLFYGFMLGDVGYGLVLLLGFYLLKKKIPAAKQLASILMFAAVISILFGFVYGEAFGFEHLGYEAGKGLCDTTGLCLEKTVHESHGHKTIIWEFPRLLDRVHSHMNVFGYEVLSILVIGAIIGFVHLNFAFLLGFLNEWKSHGFMHAVLAKLSWVSMQAGIIIAILAGMGILVSNMLWVGVGIAILSVILLGVGEGLQGIVEIPGLLSNVLSYMRLGAVGLASVGLAVVVNEDLALPFIQKGGVFVVLGILIMIIGHTINILLGVIGPFLHGIRLHYVEFFSKFFHGGGSEYNPFRKEMPKKAS